MPATRSQTAAGASATRTRSSATAYDRSARPSRKLFTSIPLEPVLLPNAPSFPLPALDIGETRRRVRTTVRLAKLKEAKKGEVNRANTRSSRRRGAKKVKADAEMDALNNSMEMMDIDIDESSDCPSSPASVRDLTPPTGSVELPYTQGYAQTEYAAYDPSVSYASYNANDHGYASPVYASSPTPVYASSPTPLPVQFGFADPYGVDDAVGVSYAGSPVATNSDVDKLAAHMDRVGLQPAASGSVDDLVDRLASIAVDPSTAAVFASTRERGEHAMLCPVAYVEPTDDGARLMSEVVKGGRNQCFYLNSGPDVNSDPEPAVKVVPEPEAVSYPAEVRHAEEEEEEAMEEADEEEEEDDGNEADVEADHDGDYGRQPWDGETWWVGTEFEPEMRSAERLRCLMAV